MMKRFRSSAVVTAIAAALALPLTTSGGHAGQSSGVLSVQVEVVWPCTTKLARGESKVWVTCAGKSAALALPTAFGAARSSSTNGMPAATVAVEDGFVTVVY